MMSFIFLTNIMVYFDILWDKFQHKRKNRKSKMTDPKWRICE